MPDYPHDPSDPHGERIVAFLKISIRRNGSMSTEGNIGDLKFALAMLDHAKDAVRQHHARIESGKRVIVPAHDTPLAGA